MNRRPHLLFGKRERITFLRDSIRGAAALILRCRVYLARARGLQVPGVLLYLHRCPDARVTEAASHLRVKSPTLTDVVQDLVRKR